MIVKVRIWSGRPTIMTENGKKISSPTDLEHWIEKQADGQIEVWAGRWWVVSKEAVPFRVEQGKCHCAHPAYRSKEGLDTHDFSGFFVHEAWMIMARLTKGWEDLPKFTSSATRCQDE